MRRMPLSTPPPPRLSSGVRARCDPPCCCPCARACACVCRFYIPAVVWRFAFTAAPFLPPSSSVPLCFISPRPPPLPLPLGPSSSPTARVVSVGAPRRRRWMKLPHPGGDLSSLSLFSVPTRCSYARALFFLPSGGGRMGGIYFPVACLDVSFGLPLLPFRARAPCFAWFCSLVRLPPPVDSPPFCAAYSALLSR